MVELSFDNRPSSNVASSAFRGLLDSDSSELRNQLGSVDADTDCREKEFILRDSSLGSEINKPDFCELDLGSPVSPLCSQPRGLTTTTSRHAPVIGSSNSVRGGSQFGSSSGNNLRPSQSRSDSATSSSHSQPLISSATSAATTPANVLPTGNLSLRKDPNHRNDTKPFKKRCSRIWYRNLWTRKHNARRISGETYLYRRRRRISHDFAGNCR